MQLCAIQQRPRSSALCTAKTAVSPFLCNCHSRNVPQNATGGEGESGRTREDTNQGTLSFHPIHRSISPPLYGLVSRPACHCSSESTSAGSAGEWLLSSRRERLRHRQSLTRASPSLSKLSMLVIRAQSALLGLACTDSSSRICQKTFEHRTPPSTAEDSLQQCLKADVVPSSIPRASLSSRKYDHDRWSVRWRARPKAVGAIIANLCIAFVLDKGQ